jgi:hypothetical protein
MENTEIWANDRLGYRTAGESFTRLITTIDQSRVLSIEAGFGRGKTFFRRNWAQQLVAAGETVVEIDAQLTDHTGDPVVTFVGALADALPQGETSQHQKTKEAVKKYGTIAVKGVMHAVFRSAADEVFEAVEDMAGEGTVGADVIANVGDQVSAAGGRMIAAQMLAERIRKKDIPEQIRALRDALVAGKPSKRVVILVDELDRCHPEYAIHLLEAMKLVFNEDGFVFCLFINDVYLENLAQHRFGKLEDGERYLDKFIDLRLRLPDSDAGLSEATHHFAQALHVAIPYGNDPAFSIGAAVDLAAKLAPESGLTLRQIKRLLERVDLVLRMYADHPIDPALLIYLAFHEASTRENAKDWSAFLPRSGVGPLYGYKVLGLGEDNVTLSLERHPGDKWQKADQIAVQQVPELTNLPRERYRLSEDRKFYVAKLVDILSAFYIPDHEAMLHAVRDLQGGRPN